MGKLCGETDAHGVFRLYCGICGDRRIQPGRFDRLGPAIVLLYLCPTCGETYVRLRPYVWEVPLHAFLPPRQAGRGHEKVLPELFADLADELERRMRERESVEDAWKGGLETEWEQS